MTNPVRRNKNVLETAVNVACHFGHSYHSFVSPGLVTILPLDLSLNSGAPNCSSLYFISMSDMLNVLTECDLVLPYPYLP